MSIQWNPRWRAVVKVLIIGTVVSKKKKKKKYSGTGTTLIDTGTTHAKRGSGHLVPVPHLKVPVPLGEKGLI